MLYDLSSTSVIHSLEHLLQGKKKMMKGDTRLVISKYVEAKMMVRANLLLLKS